MSNKTVIGVKFKELGKIYFFNPKGEKFEKGDFVIVETSQGEEYGEVAISNRIVPDETVVKPLKKVVRIATYRDKKHYEENKQKEKEAFGICKQKIKEHKLEMTLTDVEYKFDNSKILFYFTADGRIDFRELVKDLAAVFRTRIELRQIGVRDEVKRCGGNGVCGRELCCCTFLGNFETVSIKMAKEQNISLNPSKISGNCGRLMCCLAYENEFYADISAKMPKLNSRVKTKDGIGVAVYNNLLKQKVTVKIDAGNEIRVAEYDLNEIEVLPKIQPEQPKKEPKPNKVENKEKTEEKPKENNNNNGKNNNNFKKNKKHNNGKK